VSIKWIDVVAVAPELAALNSNSQTQILAMVDRQIDDTAWGGLADDGRRFLSAHYGTLAIRKGSGFITSERVGSLGRSYATPQWLKSSLGLTSYGIEYRRLARLLPTYLGSVF